MPAPAVGPPSLEPPRAASSRLAAALLLVVALGGSGGCGGPQEVGGAGRLLRAGDPGALDHLVVAGTPYEMGWWHGRLLAAQVRSQASEPLPPDLADALRAYATGMRVLLPPPAEQELRGIAAGAGVRPDDLFLVEAGREGIRWHDPATDAPRVEIQVASVVRDAPEILVSLRAPARETRRACPRPILVERHPSGGAATLVLAYPGELGAFAGVSDRGLVAFEAPAADADPDRRSLRGPPFPVAFRLALERSGTAREMVEGLPGLLGNLVAVADAEGGRRGGLVRYGGDPPGDPSGPAFPLRASWAPDLRIDREGIRLDRQYSFAGVR